MFLASDLRSLIDELIVEHVDESISAAALSGSYARGDADAYSDLDVRLYTDHPVEGVEADRLLYRHGRLVSISMHTFRGEARQFAAPAQAVFAVAPVRGLVPLLDREGKLKVLQDTARAFRWDAIAPEADQYAARVVYSQAEVVHKLTGSLAQHFPLRAVITASELVQELTLAVAVARRVLVDSDRSYLQQVYDAVGTGADWTNAHRSAFGVADQPDYASTVQGRGMAALDLYRETAELLAESFTNQQREVVTEALRQSLIHAEPLQDDNGSAGQSS